MFEHRLFLFNPLFLVNHSFKVIRIQEGKMLQRNQSTQLLETKAI